MIKKFSDFATKSVSNPSTSRMAEEDPPPPPHPAPPPPAPPDPGRARPRHRSRSRPSSRDPRTRPPVHPQSPRPSPPSLTPDCPPSGRNGPYGTYAGGGGITTPTTREGSLSGRRGSIGTNAEEGGLLSTHQSDRTSPFGRESSLGTNAGEGGAMDHPTPSTSQHSTPTPSGSGSSAGRGDMGAAHPGPDEADGFTQARTKQQEKNRRRREKLRLNKQMGTLSCSQQAVGASPKRRHEEGSPPTSEAKRGCRPTQPIQHRQAGQPSTSRPSAGRGYKGKHPAFGRLERTGEGRRAPTASHPLGGGRQPERPPAPAPANARPNAPAAVRSYASATRAGAHRLRLVSRDPRSPITASELDGVRRYLGPDIRRTVNHPLLVTFTVLRRGEVHIDCMDSRTAEALKRAYTTYTTSERPRGFVPLLPGELPPYRRYISWIPGTVQPQEVIDLLGINYPDQFHPSDVIIGTTGPSPTKPGTQFFKTAVLPRTAGFIQANSGLLSCMWQLVRFKPEVPGREQQPPTVEEESDIGREEEEAEMQPPPLPEPAQHHAGRQPLSLETVSSRGGRADPRAALRPVVPTSPQPLPRPLETGNNRGSRTDPRVAYRPVVPTSPQLPQRSIEMGSNRGCRMAPRAALRPVVPTSPQPLQDIRVSVERMDIEYVPMGDSQVDDGSRPVDPSETCQNTQNEQDPPTSGHGL